MFLAHAGFEWILAGIVVVTGLLVFGRHIVRGNIPAVILGALVWWFVYKIHGGTIQGSMTATFAALLFDLIGMPVLKLFRRR